MVELTEDELVESLIWSDQSYSLSGFLDEYQLPQVVRVVESYDGGSENTSLNYGEVLTLHALRSTQKLEAKDNHGHAIAIAMDSPHKVQVLPSLKDCKFDSCRVEALPLVFPKVKYVQVLEGHNEAENKGGSTKEGELFQIINADKRKHKVKVRNLETGLTSTLSFKCSVVFTPLLDWRSYCVRDLKSRFGFPTRVRCQGSGITKGEALTLVSSETNVTIVKEIEEVLVVATIVGGSPGFKYCYEIPTDLQVKITVAKGLLKEDGNYQEVLTKLNKRLDASKLLNNQQSTLFKRRNAITEYNYESNRDLFLDVKVQHKMKSPDENPLPAVTPRQSHLSRTTSFSECPPVTLKKPVTKPRSMSTNDDEKLKSVDVFKPRCMSAPVELGNQEKNLPLTPPRVPLCPQNVPEEVPVVSSEDSGGSPSVPNVTAPKLPSRQPIALASSQNNLTNELGEPKHNSMISRYPSSDTPPNALELGPQNVFKETSEHHKGFQSTDESTLIRSSLDACLDVPPKLPSRQPSIIKGSTSKPSPDLSSKNIEDREYLVPSDILGTRTNLCPDNIVYETYPGNMENNLDDSIYEEIPFPQDDFLENGSYKSISATESFQRLESDSESHYAKISKIPQDLSCLSVKDVAQLLKQLRMECYVETFEEEMIDGHLLKNLKEDDLHSLKVSSFHVTKLIEFIKGWRPKHL